jgi:RNA polymerase II subunit A-like phosphatase
LSPDFLWYDQQSRKTRIVSFPGPHFTQINTHTYRTVLWQAAETFGAVPSLSLTSNITHCVTATLGTEKTYRASKLGVPVVWEGWFWQSVNLWERQDERIWLAVQPAPRPGEPPTPGPSEPTTPALPKIELQAEGKEPGGEDADAEEFEGDEDVGEGWGEDADAELDAFLGGSSDWGSEAGDR